MSETRAVESEALKVACRWKYCRSKIGEPCSTVSQSGPCHGNFVERKPHAVRIRDAARLRAARQAQEKP